MRSFKRCLVGFAFCFTAASFAAQSNIERGGLGYLFQDHNSFNNPGQFAVSHGAAVQMLYGTQNVASPEQTLTPSFVYGNGRFGLGVYGSRMSTDPLGSSSYNNDTVGAGMGISLMKERLTLGVGYDRNMSAGVTTNGIANVSLTLNAPGRKGVFVGLGYVTSLDTGATNGIKTAIGFSFKSNNSFEINYTAPDVSNLGAYTAGAFLTLGGQSAYLGLGGQYLSQFAQYQALGRGGVILGQVDFSVFGATLLTSGSSVNFGATGRVAF